MALCADEGRNDYAPVDAARAVYLGLVVVGHRMSAAVGAMFWALPGRSAADSQSLALLDPRFNVINQPDADALAKLSKKAQTEDTQSE